MSPDRQNHHVVIVPGVRVLEKHCVPLTNHLAQVGMPVHMFGYPRLEWSVDRAALMLASFVDSEVLQSRGDRSVSVVGIETGTLIARLYLSHYQLLAARRCVLVADARHPADAWRQKRAGWFARRRFGVVLAQLTEGPEGFAAQCGVPPVPYGVLVTDATLPAGTDPRDNELVRSSLCASPSVLKDALGVVYVADACATALRVPRVHECISEFLLHGWFANA